MSLKSRAKSTVRKASETARSAAEKIPGPSSNPATNLLIMDIAMRGASMIAGRAIQRVILGARYDPQKAADIVKGRSLVQSMAATSAARVATRSVPGLLLVTGGLLAKTLIDRSLRPRDARRKGDKQLAAQAAKVEDESSSPR
ncbi:MAG TPA: hypothetical protein VI168_13545 [Croceibacterium sp.]